MTTPTGFKEAYGAYRGGRLDRPAGARRIWRPGPARRRSTPSMQEFVSSANLASACIPGLTQGAIAALIVHGTRGAEGDLPAEDDRGRLDRHHEPHRAALRHRSRPAQDQGRAERRRLLRDHRHQDLHLGRRARPRREHRPSGARPHRGRAGRAPRASRSSSCRSSSSSADGSLGARNGVACGSIEHKMGIHGNATCVMNYDGATGWLVGEENRGLNAMFVMMNEARLARRHPGPGAIRGRLPERRRLREGPPAGPRAHRRRRSPDKPADPIIVHPDVRRTLLSIKALQRGGARARRSGPRSRPTSPTARRMRRSARRPTTTWPDDAGGEGRAHRPRLRQCRQGAADVRRPRLHRGMGHGAVRARCPHHHDLRGRQRHPGARPRRPQARRKDGGRAVMAFFKRGRRLLQGARGRTRR